jgi:RNase P/RNase MRP subunit p29
MMLRRPSRIPREIIGKRIAVVSSGNKTLEGVEGIVVDETRNALIISAGKVEKKVLKGSVVVMIDGERIDGKRLMRRPEDR